MALVQIAPDQAHVRWDRRAAYPAELRWRGRRLRIIGLSAVRDERAAYPAARGPRVTFVLDLADGGRAVVAYDQRRRRWFVEALEAVADPHRG